MQAWTALLEQIDSERVSAAARGGSLWFRGQARADTWLLHSSLHRSIIDIQRECDAVFDDKEIRKLLRDEAKSTYAQFRSIATPSLTELQRTPWGEVFAMQHHGLPTRLLDWTKSFACALFFARSEWVPGESLAIYTLDPHAVNQASIGVAGEVILDLVFYPNSNVPTMALHPGIAGPAEVLPSIAVQPVYTHARMTVQQSRFVICGDSFAPLDAQFPHAVKKHTVSYDLRNEVDAFLGLVGMSWANYFPDLEGYAREHLARETSTLNRIRALKNGPSDA